MSSPRPIAPAYTLITSQHKNLKTLRLAAEAGNLTTIESILKPNAALVPVRLTDNAACLIIQSAIAGGDLKTLRFLVRKLSDQLNASLSNYAYRIYYAINNRRPADDISAQMNSLFPAIINYIEVTNDKDAIPPPDDSSGEDVSEDEEDNEAGNEEEIQKLIISADAGQAKLPQAAIVSLPNEAGFNKALESQEKQKPTLSPMFFKPKMAVTYADATTQTFTEVVSARLHLTLRLQQS